MGRSHRPALMQVWRVPCSQTRRMRISSGIVTTTAHDFSWEGAHRENQSELATHPFGSGLSAERIFSGGIKAAKLGGMPIRTGSKPNALSGPRVTTLRCDVIRITSQGL